MGNKDPRAVFQELQTGATSLEVLHICFAGRSLDMPLSSLKLTGRSSEGAIKMAVASCLNVGVEELDTHVIERLASGNLILRPEAVFG